MGLLHIISNEPSVGGVVEIKFGNWDWMGCRNFAMMKEKQYQNTHAGNRATKENEEGRNWRYSHDVRAVEDKRLVALLPSENRRGRSLDRCCERSGSEARSDFRSLDEENWINLMLVSKGSLKTHMNVCHIQVHLARALRKKDEWREINVTERLGVVAADDDH